MKEKYYYLDGKEKVGPLTFENLEKLKLDSNTLVWSDESNKWQRLADIDNIQENDEINNSKFISPRLNKLKIFIGTATIIIVVISISFGIVEYKKSNYKADMLSKIDKIFNEKSEIIAGQNYKTNGSFETIKYPEIILLTSEIFKLNELNLKALYKRKNGGFEIKKLKRLSDYEFELDIVCSRDIGIINTNYPRSSYISYIYNEAYNQFINQYSNVDFNDISNFPYLSNQYFYIGICEPQKRYFNNRMSSEWGTLSDYDNNIKIGEYLLFYNIKGNHYEIIENEDATNKDIVRFIKYGLGIFGFILGLLLIFKSPILKLFYY